MNQHTHLSQGAWAALGFGAFMLSLFVYALHGSSWWVFLGLLALVAAFIASDED